MQVLLTGANGFIGSHLRRALLAQGHVLVCPTRQAGPAHPGCRWLEASLADADAVQWRRWLTGCDAAVNAVGIFRETRQASFETLHVQMPVAMFRACVDAGVPRVLQLSALGATAEAPEAFLKSKFTADEALLSLPLDATVLQPSLVFGAEGASSQQFLVLASLPVTLLPAGGRQWLQPVHVDDVVTAMCELLDGPAADRRGNRIALVGPEPLMLRDYLRGLRRALGLPPVPALALPGAWMRWMAVAAEHLPLSMLSRDAWTMLQRGNTASAEAMTLLLGQTPRPVAKFIRTDEAAGMLLQAQLRWLLPLLRLSLAAVWVVTAIVSLGLYPLSQSLALLEQAGVPEAWRPAALYASALLDLVLGVLCLYPLRQRSWRRWVWAAQAALVLGYTAIITIRLPEFWLHPYGPITKNLPLLALLLLLWTLDRPAPAQR